MALSEYDDLKDIAAQLHKAGDHVRLAKVLDKMDAIKATAEAPPYQINRRAGDVDAGVLGGVVEPIASAVTGALGVGAGALGGVIAAPFVGFDRARQISSEVSSRLMFEPRSRQGKAVNAAIGSVLEPVSRAITAPERFAQQIPEQYGGKTIAGAVGLGTDVALALSPGLRRPKVPDMGLKNLGVNAPIEVRAGEAAQGLIEKAGGTPSKAGFDAGIKGGVADKAAVIKKVAGGKYSAVSEKIGDKTRVSTPKLNAYLDEKLADVGGNVKALDQPDQLLYSKLGRDKPPPQAPKITAVHGTPEAIKQRQALIAFNQEQALIPPKVGDMTYGELDSLRRNVGKGFQKKGAFGDTDQFALNELYSRMGGDQMAAAEQFGAGQILKDAQNLSSQYIGIQKNLEKLYGKKLEGSILPKIKTAANGLLNGDVSGLNKIVAALPTEYQSGARAAVFNELMTRGGKGAALSPKFSQTMKALSPEARAELLRGFPPEIGAELDRISKLSEMMASTPKNEAFLQRTLGVIARHPFSTTAAAEAMFGMAGFPGAVAGMAGATEAFKLARGRRAERLHQKQANALLKE